MPLHVHWRVYIYFNLFILSQCQNLFLLDELIKNKYDKRVRPLNGGPPVDVTTQIFILHIGPLDERTFTFDISFYLRQWWNDPRIYFNESYAPITHNYPPSDLIWTPDQVIVNARSFVQVANSVRTVLHPNGGVYTSRRIKATCTCVMDLRYYPMDRQYCPVTFESYAFPTTHLRFTWHQLPIHYNENSLLLSGYDLIRINTEKTTPSLMVGNITEYYDDLTIKFSVKRTFTFFLYKAYAPTMILMAFNFGAYWIPPDAIPARMTVIVTTMLANAVILQSVTEQTVKVSYTTPMQLFLLVNVIFIAAAIIEYLIVLYVTFNQRNAETEVKEKNVFPESSNDAINESHDDKMVNNTTDEKFVEGYINPTFETGADSNMCLAKKIFCKICRNHTNKKQKKRTGAKIDRFCRFIMPITYCLFCGIYFGYYQHMVRTVHEKE